MTSRAGLRIAVYPIAALLVLAPSRATGQEAGSIPLDLAVALLFGTSPGGDCVIHVGEAPEGFALTWPSGTRLLGASENPQRTTVAAVVPGAGEDVRRRIEASLRETGWVQPDPPPHMQGGFQDRAAPWGMYCSEDGDYRTLKVSRRDSAESLVLVTQIRADGRRHTPCAAPPERFRPPFADVLPLLHPPEGSRMIDGGRGTSGRSVESRAEIRGETGIAALLEHFAGQLEEAGWERISEASGPEAGVISWSFEHEREPWIGYLWGMEAPAQAVRYLGVGANRRSQAE